MALGELAQVRRRALRCWVQLVDREMRVVDGLRHLAARGSREALVPGHLEGLICGDLLFEA